MFLALIVITVLSIAFSVIKVISGFVLRAFMLIALVALLYFLYSSGAFDSVLPAI